MTRIRHCAALQGETAFFSTSLARFDACTIQQISADMLRHETRAEVYRASLEPLDFLGYGRNRAHGLPNDQIL
jgi:hypothetical protein